MKTESVVAKIVMAPWITRRREVETVSKNHPAKNSQSPKNVAVVSVRP